LNNQESKIEVSFTLKEKHQDQVLESINEQIKALVTKTFLIKDTKALRE
jgi:hypothetical protein